MNDNADRLVEAERNVSPAFALFEAGEYALEKADAAQEGDYYELLTAVLMAAFTFEAFLNHCGTHVWGDGSERWAVIERSSPISKLRALCEEVRFELDLGSAPFQDLSTLFKVRDSLVHGKTESFRAQIPLSAARTGMRRQPELQPRWEQCLTHDYARRVLANVRDASERLSAHIGLTNPLLIGDSGSYGG